MKKQKYAFTLVELIVVITILAILGTIAFISLQGYSKQARDSTRVASVSTMKTALELFFLDSAKYPLADNYYGVSYSGDVLWNQGTFGEDVITNLSRSFSKIPKDPLLDKEYIYSTTWNRGEFEILNLLESDLTFNNFSTEVNAAEVVMTPRIEGVYNGIYIKTSTHIVPTPSIINSEVINGGLAFDSNTIKSQVTSNGSNVPKNGNINQSTGGLDISLNVYSGSINNKSSSAEKQAVAELIQATYRNSILATDSKYKNILNLTTPEELVLFVNSSIFKNSVSTYDEPPCVYDSCIGEGFYVIKDTNLDYINGCKSTNLPGYDSEANMKADLTENNPFYKCIYYLSDTGTYISPGSTDSYQTATSTKMSINETVSGCDSVYATCDYIRNYPSGDNAVGYCTGLGSGGLSWYLPSKIIGQTINANVSNIYGYNTGWNFYWTSTYTNPSTWKVTYNTTSSLSTSYINGRQMRCVNEKCPIGQYWLESDNSCYNDTAVVNCSAKPTGTDWTNTSSVTQNYDYDVREIFPSNISYYDEFASANTCAFKCTNPALWWDGTACIDTSSSCSYDECLDNGAYVVHDTNLTYVSGCDSTNLPGHDSEANMKADGTKNNPFYNCIYKLDSLGLYISPGAVDSSQQVTTSYIHTSEDVTAQSCTDPDSTCAYLKGYNTGTNILSYCTSLNNGGISWYLPPSNTNKFIYTIRTKLLGYNSGWNYYWSSTNVSSTNWITNYNSTSAQSTNKANARQARCIYK